MPQPKPQLELKVVEIQGHRSGRAFTDYLIADKTSSVGDIIAGKEAIYCEVQTKLTGDIIVKSVNNFPDMVDLLHRNLAAWDDEEDSVKEEHADLITELRSFLEGL